MIVDPFVLIFVVFFLLIFYFGIRSVGEKAVKVAVDSENKGSGGWCLVPAKKLEAVKVASSLGLQGPSAPIGAQLLASAGGTDDHASATTTVYHANLVAGSNSSVTAALQQSPLLTSLNSAAALASMQASAEANSLDLQAMQSMDWLFKKERIYLLAQFWQQVSRQLHFTGIRTYVYSRHESADCERELPTLSAETKIFHASDQIGFEFDEKSINNF